MTGNEVGYFFFGTITNKKASSELPEHLGSIDRGVMECFDCGFAILDFGFLLG